MPAWPKLRQQQHFCCYSKLTNRDWNDYVQLGINLCQIHVAKESPDDKSLCLACYFRFHLENKAEVLPLLLKIIASIETALSTTHPGFLDMFIYCNEYALYSDLSYFSNFTATWLLVESLPESSTVDTDW